MASTDEVLDQSRTLDPMQPPLAAPKESFSRSHSYSDETSKEQQMLLDPASSTDSSDLRSHSLGHQLTFTTRSRVRKQVTLWLGRACL